VCGDSPSSNDGRQGQQYGDNKDRVQGITPENIQRGVSPVSLHSVLPEVLLYIGIVSSIPRKNSSYAVRLQDKDKVIQGDHPGGDEKPEPVSKILYLCAQLRV
ncbi:MAG TPA: hypothetical protein PKV86_10240, partial [Syntrophobacteraceae bacterium]|nr:hypothetical protein [Syntrophobacteraceae bacterium]